MLWVSLCTPHGEVRTILPEEGDGAPLDPAAKACHSVCTMREERGRGRQARRIG